MSSATNHALAVMAAETDGEPHELVSGIPKYRVGETLHWLLCQRDVEVMEHIAYDSRIDVHWYRCRYTDRAGVECHETIPEQALRRPVKPGSGGPDNTIEVADMIAARARP